MADRTPSRRARESADRELPGRRPRKKGSGGARVGAGRKRGSVSSFNRYAIAEARKRGMLPHELLHEWALTGQMSWRGNREKYDLSTSEVIECAKAAAPYYGQKLAPRVPEGAKPPVYEVKLDMAEIAKAGVPLDQLQMLRAVVEQLSKGIPGLAALVPGAQSSKVDASMYGKSLSADSETAGRA